MDLVMALSDHEKRVLGEIEAELSAHDAHWVRRMSWARRKRSAALRAGLWVLAGATLGFAMIAVGVGLASGTGEALALVGYLIVVISAGWLVSAACARLRGRNQRHG